MTSRPWSKYSKGSSAYMRKHPEEAKTMNKQSKANVAQGEGANSEEDLEKEEERKKKGRIG